MERKLAKSVEWIFFDLGWTLVYPSSGHWLFTAAAEPYLAATDRKLAYATMERCWGAVNDEGHLWLCEAQQWDAYQEALRRTSEALGLGWSEADLRTMTDDYVYSDTFYQLYDGVPELLARLSKRYKLGVISDTVPTAGRELARLGILPYFSSVTFSCYVNARKPDPAIFRHALLSSGAPGERAVFVDDLEKNLVAAGEFGMGGVQICAGPHVIPSTQFATISDIREIEALL